MNEKQFPNGFTSWQETHYEVVSFLTLALEREHDLFYNMLGELVSNKGIGHLYELAEGLTDMFEGLNCGREWDGEFFEELESFMLQELKKL
jgi:hypothetical protein